MNKRGRPKKNGQVPPWMLERVTIVLYAYERARAAGAKHLTAVQETVGFVRANRPLMPISETAVKRILAEWRSNRSRSCLSVTKPDPAHSTITLPTGRVARVVLTAGWGPRIEYPRANAALPSTESNDSTV
jgi:hypothetical protein